jgi:diguanylate cyclase (GGDEF)-like protein
MENDKRSLKETSILVVAAQEDVKMVLREAMLMAGYQCFTASNGSDAIDQLSQNCIDVVITDIKMPLMDGLELTTNIREKYDSDVIVIAGFADDISFEEIIARGASELLLKPINLAELYMRIRRVLSERTLLLERNAAMQMLKESEQRYQELSITDGLTNIFNARQFYSTLRTEIERSRRYGHPLSVLMLDIDDFKKYNDTYGHLEGDKVLIKLARIIQGCLRQNDAAYRYGGEEFSVILPVTTGEQGMVAADRVRVGMRSEAFNPSSGKNIHVTVSIGVAQYRRDEDIMDFLRRADQNLYAAKASGKDRVYYLMEQGQVGPG